MKRARCAKAGIESRLVSLPATTTTAEPAETLQSLSQTAEVRGFLLQQPRTVELLRGDEPAATVRESDVVVAAAGRPRRIRGEDIKPGAS